MDRITLAWIAFGAYMAVTAWLAWLGHKKTDGLESFALGKRDMGPLMVGITMAAAMSSTATFIINPGFVYTHGLAAFMHFGVAIGLGIGLALLTLSLGFRKVGMAGGALSLPHWIGERYQSLGLRVLFGAFSLLSITFVVLIVGGVQIMLERTLEMSPQAALLLTIGFVFSYILVGGTYAHTYTNSLQGVLMVIVALAIAVKTAVILGDGAFWADLNARLPQLTAWVNADPVPAGPGIPVLFGDVFSVYVAGSVIGFAVVCQPHLLMKSLYLKSDADVPRYVGITLVVTAIFFSLLLGGLAAHAVIQPGDVPQDRIMVTWLQGQFSDVPYVLISVALVAAGMSTLDGILVAMSTIASNDLFLPLAQRGFLKGRPLAAQQQVAYRVGQGVLVGHLLVRAAQVPGHLRAGGGVRAVHRGRRPGGVGRAGPLGGALAARRVGHGDRRPGDPLRGLRRGPRPEPRRHRHLRHLGGAGGGLAGRGAHPPPPLSALRCRSRSSCSRKASQGSLSSRRGVNHT